MPYIDLNTRTSSDLRLDPFDITIVGAGAAGILLAVNLAKGGKKVLLLESGHYGEDSQKQQLNEVEQTGKFLENAVWGRKRALGGSTIAWGGQSLPFQKLDFQRREWVKESGWPLEFEEVAPYYKDANAFMGIDKLNYGSDILPGLLLRDPEIAPSLLSYHVSKWAAQPDFHQLYKNFLDENVLVLYNAHLTGLDRQADGRVGVVRFTNFTGGLFSCNPGILIIAAGGIETTRILLHNGLGNHSGLLGRFFMEHPCIEAGEVETRDMYRLQKFFNTHVWQGRKYSIRLSLTEKLQRQEQLLNCSASIMFPPPAGEFDAYEEIKSFKRDLRLKRLLKISGDSPNIMKSVWAFYKDRFYFKVNAVGRLVLMTEQEPTRESFIALSDQRDRFGIPKARIHWDITLKTWETVLATSMTFKTGIEEKGFGQVRLYPRIDRDNKEWMDCLSDVNHHMGGCRMSASPEEGVVDRNLQVWGVPNLFLCSCAVFPTSSHSNPTLTLLALGLRLSDRILKNR